MRESPESRVALEGVSLPGIKLLLRYIYTGQVNCNELDVDSILELLEIAHMYGVEKLQTSLSRYLQGILCAQNVCEIYCRALVLPSMDDLTEACLSVIDKHSDTLLKSYSICDLSATALAQILNRGTSYADELDVFKAVARWSADHPTDEKLPVVLEAIRLPLIPTKDLLTTVRDSGLIPENRLLEALRTREFTPNAVDYRERISRSWSEMHLSRLAQKKATRPSPVQPGLPVGITTALSRPVRADPEELFWSRHS